MKSIELVICAVLISCVTSCKDKSTRAIPGRCGLYELCQDNQWHVMNCGFGLRFDKISQTCTFFGKANCCNVENGCVDYVSRKPDTSDCTKYLGCRKCSWEEESCESGMMFDANINRCTGKGAFCATTKLPPVTVTTSPQTTPSQPTPKALSQTPPAADGKCSKDGDKYHGTSQKFYEYFQCVNGVWQNKKCPSCGMLKMKKFDNKTNNCSQICQLWF